MAVNHFAALYDTYADAAQAVTALEAAGIKHADLSIVSRKHRAQLDRPAEDEDDNSGGVGTGATIGTIVGGGAGLLCGLGMLAIPGIGPVVAAGWLIATLAGAGVGAAAGGLIGALTEAGFEHSHAKIYAEGVRRGGTLVTVRADETREGEVRAILDRYNPVDIEERGEFYRSSGWTGLDDDQPESAAE